MLIHGLYGNKLTSQVKCWITKPIYTPLATRKERNHTWAMVLLFSDFAKPINRFWTPSIRSSIRRAISGSYAVGKKKKKNYQLPLAWQIPWTEEPGRLQSTGSLEVGHDWATSLSLFTFMHWRRKWQPTPVFLPGESQGRGSLVGRRLWGRTESDMTEAT